MTNTNYVKIRYESVLLVLYQLAWMAIGVYSVIGVVNA